MSQPDFYNKAFYNTQKDMSYKSASTVLPYVLKHFPEIKRVTDIGCGLGTWLAVAKSMNCQILGRDSHNQEGDLYIDRSEFVRTDLACCDVPELQEKPFDLAISLEVAEHIPEESANNFIRFICSQSDLVLFSAAIPLQGGVNHINEQWQSYWRTIFEQNNYLCFDSIRNQFWTNEDVEFWYAQNSFLYVNREKKNLCEQAATLHTPMPMDVRHPKAITKRIKKTLRQKIRKLVGF